MTLISTVSYRKTFVHYSCSDAWFVKKIFCFRYTLPRQKNSVTLNNFLIILISRCRQASGWTISGFDLLPTGRRRYFWPHHCFHFNRIDNTVDMQFRQNASTTKDMRLSSRKQQPLQNSDVIREFVLSGEFTRATLLILRRLTIVSMKSVIKTDTN